MSPNKSFYSSSRRSMFLDALMDTCADPCVWAYMRLKVTPSQRETLWVQGLHIHMTRWKSHSCIRRQVQNHPLYSCWVCPWNLGGYWHGYTDFLLSPQHCSEKIESSAWVMYSEVENVGSAKGITGVSHKFGIGMDGGVVSKIGACSPWPGVIGRVDKKYPRQPSVFM